MSNFTSSLVRNTALVAALLGAGIAGAAGPNLVNNGSFSDGLTGWTELIANSHSGLNYQNRYLANPSPNDGGNNFGVQVFRGTYNDGNSGRGIFQEITGLTVGNTYELVFYQTGSDFRWSGEEIYWEVTFGKQVKNGTTVKAEPGNDNYLWSGNWNRTDATGDDINKNFRWSTSRMTFVATEETQQLIFNERQTAATRANWDTSVTPYGTPTVLLLDGVSLTNITPVPEASTTSMILAGVSVLALIVTRRRKQER